MPGIANCVWDRWVITSEVWGRLEILGAPKLPHGRDNEPKSPSLRIYVVRQQVE
jgi:hypothetical protein